MTLLYFAWLRQTIGVAREDIALPAHVVDAAGVLRWLKGRGGGYARALADESAVRMAVNQTHAGPHTVVTDDDEVALFPPVTGG